MDESSEFENIVREYFRRNLRKLYNPYNESSFKELNDEEIELSLDFLTEVLKKKIEEERLQQLDEKFYSAFNQYLNTSRFYTGAILNGIERLSSLFEPFLKKIVFLYFPNKKTNNGKPLWHEDIDSILRGLGLTKSDITKKDESYWASQLYDQGILRLECVTRHKGVHESHNYGLVEVERIIRAILSSYMLVSYLIVYRKDIKKDFSANLEMRILNNLLSSKISSYPRTGSILTPKEHLNIYKYKSKVEPREDIFKFLFINYIHDKGPIFFWAKDQTKKNLINEARKFLAIKNPDIQRSAVRFLILMGEPFSMNYLNKLFLHYEFKSEYEMMIKNFSKRKDISLLIALCKKKRLEEVRSAAKEACLKLLTLRNTTILQKIVSSSNKDLRWLFEKFALQNASKKILEQYRTNTHSKKLYKKVMSIYSLGVVGDVYDIDIFRKELKKKRINKILKEAYIKSITRLLIKNNEIQKVNKFVKSNNKIIAKNSIMALPAEFIVKNIHELAKIYDKYPEEISEIFYSVPDATISAPVKELLKIKKLDNHARNLILYLCKVGEFSELDFLIKLFSGCNHKISFWNPIYVGKRMASIASEKNKNLLKKFISSKEFWTYFGEKNRPKNKMPIKFFENVHLLKGIIGIIYSSVATMKDLNILIKMLHHNYRLTALSVAKRIGEIATDKDIEGLINVALSEENDDIINNFVACIREIDEKLYFKN